MTPTPCDLLDLAEGLGVEVPTPAGCFGRREDRRELLRRWGEVEPVVLRALRRRAAELEAERGRAWQA